MGYPCNQKPRGLLSQQQICFPFAQEWMMFDITDIADRITAMFSHSFLLRNSQKLDVCALSLQ